MSRGDSSQQFVFEFATLGNALSEWIGNSNNKLVLADTINRAIAEYEKNRIDRIHFLGKPDFSSGENADVVDQQGRVPPLSTAEQTLSDVAVSLTTRAASTALNCARFLASSTANYVLSDSAKQFREAFRIIDGSNAQLAFLYIGCLSSSSWAVENHTAIGRPSLNTLIFSRVFDIFMNQDVGKRDMITTLDDADSGGDMISWVIPANSVTSCPILANCLDLYRENKIAPLSIPDQARDIFIAFLSTPTGMRLNEQLKAFLNPIRTPSL